MTPLRVMIVEDNAMIAMVLAEILEEMGHDICSIAVSETDAVAEALRLRPELIIADLRLRHGAGVSVIDKTCRIVPTAHIFISGDLAGIRAFRPNAVTLQKPFREPDLIRAIDPALSAVTH
jgi:CheY-like chemotaxis protein